MIFPWVKHFHTIYEEKEESTEASPDRSVAEAESGSTFPEPAEEADEGASSPASESGISAMGRVAANLLSHLNNDMAIGRRIKSGELRKRLVEPECTVPEPFNMTTFTREHYSMKLLTRKADPRTDMVILQLHGGGYQGPVRNAYYVLAGLYNEVSRGMSVLTPDYRVAPEDPYPAALEDAADAYTFLLEQGYAGDQIIVGGDSAGGGLALALTMYLRDHDQPLPRGIIAMSPWTDLTASGPSYESNYEKDIVFGNTKESLIYLSEYAAGMDKTNPYISPAFGSFENFPPVLLQVGSEEMLLSDSQTVAAKLRALGRKVRLSVYEGMFHDFQLAYLMLPESRRAWTEVGRFIEILMKDDRADDIKNEESAFA